MNQPPDLAAMSGEEMETEETPAAIPAQTSTPEDQFLAFPDWLARNTGDGSSEIERQFAVDPLAKYRGYSDYSRRTLLRQGRWNEELPQLIDSRLAQLAIDSGDYPVEEGQEVDISDVLAKPPGAEFDLDALQMFGLRTENEALSSAAAMVKAVEQRKLDGDVFPDYDTQYSSAIDTLRTVATPDVLADALREKVRRGDVAAALIPPTDPNGQPEVFVSEELLEFVNPEDGSIDTRALEGHLSSRNTDPGLISGVLFKLSRPEGYNKTRMEIEKQYDLLAQLELARATPNAEAGERIGELFQDRSHLDRKKLMEDRGTYRVNTLLEEALEGAQNFLDLEGEGVGIKEALVSGRNPTRAFEHIAFDLKDALRGTPMGDLPEEQFNDLIMDYVKRNVDEKWEGKDPATVLKTLSTGEVVAPFSLMLQKDKFEQALKSVPSAQHAKLRAEQEYTVEANARSVADVIINAPEGGDKFLRFMEQEQAKGKTLGQITQDWASQGNYTGAMSRARGVGYSVLDAAGALVFTLPALMGNETSLKNLQAIQAKKNSSRAYAELSRWGRSRVRARPSRTRGTCDCGPRGVPWCGYRCDRDCPSRWAHRPSQHDGVEFVGGNEVNDRGLDERCGIPRTRCRRGDQGGGSKSGQRDDCRSGRVRRRARHHPPVRHRCRVCGVWCDRVQPQRGYDLRESVVRLCVGEESRRVSEVHRRGGSRESSRAIPACRVDHRSHRVWVPVPRQGRHGEVCPEQRAYQHPAFPHP
jgi:hypothetical protein